MPQSSPTRSRAAALRRTGTPLVVGLSALALLAGGSLASLPGGTAAADPAEVNPYGPSDAYINYAAPQFEAAVGEDVQVGEAERVVAEAKAYGYKHAEGNPRAAEALAKAEQKAVRTGRNPREFKKAPATQEARLLTLLVEYDEDVSYDWSGVMVPRSVNGDRTCVPAADVPSGPLHNNIPDPADWAEGEDNNSFWVEDFSSEHYNKMLYTDEGITERVRPDLTGPDGEPGIDISGYTMKAMYEEMSKGAYTVDGEASPWITLDNSEAYYAADTCQLVTDDEGNQTWEAGRVQDMDGYPGSGGPQQMALDAVTKLHEMDPDFPWADYDVEDQGDVDGDGDLYEPDGVVDHLVLVHAGEDKSGGGGTEGTYAIWAHSSALATAPEIGDTGIRISNYIVQPEDSGVGVFAHEYGHDLGLPDLYDVTSGGDSDVDFWDLMSSGSHAGPIFQSMPTHMGLWDKWVLGWVDPLEFNPGDRRRTVQVGQTSRTPRGSEDGLIINLPNKVQDLGDPHSGENMWWSGQDGDWADFTLTRSIDVPATDPKFWMWNDYVIEEDWDFGFVEVSTDGGATWVEQKVFDDAGNEVTTPEGYPDPNGNLAGFGGKKYGLTGSSEGWRHDYIDLSAFAGQSIQVRLRQATDAAFLERGWFADDFSVTSGSQIVWSDDVEGGTNGWTTAVGSWVAGSAPGTGWTITTGEREQAQYYLAEWRNYDGFDEGLKYAYDTTYASNGPWKVEKIAYNAPGLLVWYRDTTYGDANPVLATTNDAPSVGSKGGLLIVDSHFDPLRRSGEAAVKDTSTLDNLPSRAQSSNAAFGAATRPFTECLAELPGEAWTNEYCTSFGSLPAVSTFDDSKGWYPGIEVRGSSLFYRDVDASTVIPNGGNEPYPVRVVDAEGNPLTELYGEDVGLSVPLGDGNPNDPYGVKLTVGKTRAGNSIAQVVVQPPKADG
ncbi:immune inhibitor A domain-containing protein [Auraticoccus monumenti]|uniref:Immune inhibitor A n=1 Tax=Auraticoccus monumenti TaxID=675864 RepID=A0A1G6XEV1_9ACTN|nr:immune inhibitor A domain-containing protein [Auraticoccus monumenti]SDD76700.1 immune inhibitor A [Auraticoccus monumenti]